MKNTTTIPTPNTIIRNNTLTSAQLLIYIYLVKCFITNTISKDYFKLNKAFIARKLHINDVKMIAPSIAKLEELGLIELSNRKVNYLDIKGDNYELEINSFKVQTIVDGMNGFTTISKELLYSETISTNDKAALIKILSLDGLKKKPTTISGMATILNVNRASFTKIIKRLCNEGYLTYKVNCLSNNKTEITDFELHLTPVEENKRTLHLPQPKKITEEENKQMEEVLTNTSITAEEELTTMTKPKEESDAMKKIKEEMASHSFAKQINKDVWNEWIEQEKQKLYEAENTENETINQNISVFEMAV